MQAAFQVQALTTARLLFALAQLANWKQATNESCSLAPRSVVLAPDRLQFIVNYVLVYAQF